MKWDVGTHLVGLKLLKSVPPRCQIASDPLQPVFGDIDIRIRWLFSTVCRRNAYRRESYGGTYLRLRERDGKNRHALLTAPNPESKPRMIVPTTVRRESTFCHRLDVGSPGGNGTSDKRKRNPPTGRAVKIKRTTDGRWTVCRPV